MYRIFDVGLPHWTTIWRAKAKLRRVLNLDVKAATSILNQSLFGLSLKSILAQEIANLVVSPMIEYYPQDAGGRNIYKLTQSKKWLHHLSKADQAQMCRHEVYDYYLFEPVQLVTNDIVVLFYFYQQGMSIWPSVQSLNL
jgi:hypothetical protein